MAAGHTSQKASTLSLVVGDAEIDVAVTLPDLGKVREQLQASLTAVDQEISRTLVSGTTMQRPDSDVGDVNWSEEKNARRFDLIDKQIQGKISFEEAAELVTLTLQLRAHTEPIERARVEATRQLHTQLLEKKRQSEKKQDKDS